MAAFLANEGELQGALAAAASLLLLAAKIRQAVLAHVAFNLAAVVMNVRKHVSI